MLELDLDLEADLGVDTVKQAETFAAVRESLVPSAGGEPEAARLPDAPPRDAVRPRPAARIWLPAVPPRAGRRRRRRPSPPALASGARSPRERRPLSPPRPVAVLRPPLELCKPTGVTLATGTRVVVAGDRGGVTAGALRAPRRRAAWRCSRSRIPALPAPSARLAEWISTGEIHGVTGCRPSTPEPSLLTLDLAGLPRAEPRARQGALRDDARSRRRGPASRGRSSSRRRAWAAASDRDGRAEAPLGGGVAGLHEGLHARAPGGARQGRGLRGEARLPPRSRTRSSRRRSPTRARSRSAARTGSASGSTLAERAGGRRTPGTGPRKGDGLPRDRRRRRDHERHRRGPRRRERRHLLAARPRRRAAKGRPEDRALPERPGSAEEGAHRGAQGPRARSRPPLPSRRQLLGIEREEAALRAIEAVEAAAGTARLSQREPPRRPGGRGGRRGDPAPARPDRRPRPRRRRRDQPQALRQGARASSTSSSTSRRTASSRS